MVYDPAVATMAPENGGISNSNGIEGRPADEASRQPDIQAYATNIPAGNSN